MRRATFFALSSEFETFGVVVVEALSQGLPVLSTSCGGPSDIVGSNDGLLTPTGDVGAMATAMQRLAAEIDSYDRAEIVRRCHERFGECGVTARFIEIYRKACE